MRREREIGAYESDHAVRGKREKRFLALKVPRQCLFFLLVNIHLGQCKALGSEEGCTLL
jgi:hypothetical protein